MEDLRKAIGDRVKKWRKRHGYSQEWFGEICDIGGRAQMSGIECGKINMTLETLQKLAHAGFGVTLSRFLSGIEREPIRKDGKKGQSK
jgi:transcriptional regulator with XRE-family HTH domain